MGLYFTASAGSGVFTDRLILQAVPGGIKRILIEKYN